MLAKGRGRCSGRALIGPRGEGGGAPVAMAINGYWP
jgi:hypothetical protein